MRNTSCTDTFIVLTWIFQHLSQRKTFISNRCLEILNILPRQNLNHVKSIDNITNYASRGILSLKLL